uniref:SNF2 N-terminal domain-containing protein n=1 Tax=Rhodosorus marinus TaxID=101924 RepID=A0A7S3AAD7_9RHOD|mmetsp:Transcript_8034/g.35733  ORF Transcript_8034/g.35733 Transcript_8034/m.35733 type:complete len:135 (+) Transcript_8034:320-724(+)
MGVERDIVKMDDVKIDKVKYLLSQSKIFGHFMGKSLVDEGTGAPRRMTEAEEDAILLEAEASTDEVTRLNEQPANIEGKMRNYQVEGLNFLIGLYERGLNGILADEMGLGKTLQTISLLGFLRLHKKVNGMLFT